jgi:tRNA A37 methylthiotransferase MiaB
MILKRMKRRHSRRDAIETVARLKAQRPEIAIGADLIAGFPTETDEMAENSLRLVEECDVVMGHIFPFSPKRGTPAALMPQVAPTIVKERARRLREACVVRRAKWLEGLVGTRQKVLIEKDGLGHCENFAPLQISHTRSSRAKSRGGGTEAGIRPSTSLGTNEVGAIMDVQVTAFENGTLIGAMSALPAGASCPRHDADRSGGAIGPPEGHSL